MKGSYAAILFTIGIVLLATIFGMQYLLESRDTPADTITSFEECVAAGNPVMESYPRQCRTADGDLFVEEIDDAAPEHNMIRLDAPIAGATVTSPLAISGEARGGWYFEASFPVRLEDSEGNVLAEGFATADGDWMTENFVPFTAELQYPAPDEEMAAVLILEKANPSGLPAQADEISVEVTLAPQEQREVTLYYYNQSEDVDADGNILCSDQGLVAVERKMPVSQTPVQDAIRLLLEGDITAQEAAAGIETEFPLAGLELIGANLEDGTLTLEFDDPQGATSGGSCRVSILRAQIEETALQFGEVDEVEILPEDIFQP